MKIKLKRVNGKEAKIYISDLPLLFRDINCDYSTLIKLSRELTGTDSESWSGIFSCVDSVNGNTKITFNAMGFSRKVEIELIDYHKDSLQEIERKIKGNIKKVKESMLFLPEDTEILEFDV